MCLAEKVDVGEKMTVAASTLQRPPNPYLKASFISKLFWNWPAELLYLGMKRPLVESDLPEITPFDSSRFNREYFQRIWNQEIEQHPEKPSLHRAILRDFVKSLWYVQPLFLMASVCKVVQALALGNLVQSFDLNNGEGYLWAGVLVACAFVVLFEHHHVFFFTWRKGMQLRIASVASIYDKSLRLSSTSTNAFTSSGTIMNLASNDVERFLMASLFIFYLFWAPAQSLAILGVGWSLLGPAFGAGFALLIVVVVPLQFILSQKFAKYRSQIAAITDRRVTLVSQAVYGARVMKLNAWEWQFQERIQAIRKEEISQIRKANSLKVWNETIFFSSNIVIAIVIFLVHISLGNTLTPRTVFATLSLLQTLQLEMTKHVSLGVMGVSECYVSITRIQKFLEYPELNESGRLSQPEPANEDISADENNNKVVLDLTNVTCHWNKTDKKAMKQERVNKEVNHIEDVERKDSSLTVAFNDATIKLRQSELTCMIGSVGSGKSAFLQALAGELPTSTGSLNRCYGTLAYASQDTWIMDGTAKENILMGFQFDSVWYEKVVNACGLKMDFDQFRNGDQTIVGDRGVQCSGGQRARLGLARALYRNADVLILDDPLSAVDAKVGRLLFNDAILGLGVNLGKCVVLATHQHQYIRDYRCVLMAKGRIECIGEYLDCVAASGGKLTAHAADTSVNDLEALEKKALAKEETDDTIIVAPNGSGVVPRTVADNSREDTSELNVQGLVHLDTFLKYAKAMGGMWVAVSLLVFFALTQASVLFTITTFGRWSERPPEQQDDWDLIGLVLGLGASVVILAFLRALLSFRLTISASQCLHDRMTTSILRAKISFFDTNPMGRILNRFSADVGSNDDLLPHTLFDFVMIAFMVLGAVVTTIAVLPFTLIVVPPLVWYFVKVRRIFVTTTRELKRLEGLARSPIFAMLSESLSGIATIRSNNGVEFFKQKFETIHDAHGRAFFAFISSSRWVGFRMDGIMFLFTTVASFLSVLFFQEGWFDIDPAVLGLSLSMLTMLAGIFQWCIRQSAEVVNQMVSVERVVAFGEIPPEAELTKNEPDLSLIRNDWPQAGSIVVKNLSVRYRDALPLSLHKVSFHIKPGHRVGVVGRTGSGKSTLVQSLFRLLEAEEGCILVDEVDISTVGLHTLRNKMSVIPQFPVLFSGCTVRENLDPFHKHSDESVRDALRDVHMDHALEDLPRGWNSMVSEGGSNFSVGQRQLLCLARAILCKNKILVLDEPTANVDRRTDQLLQEALQKSFKGATIFSVAHRLDTVIEYDEILVLGGGELLEYGSPSKLLEQSDGHFSSMVRDTGDLMSQDLRRRATQVHQEMTREIP